MYLVTFSRKFRLYPPVNRANQGLLPTFLLLVCLFFFSSTAACAKIDTLLEVYRSTQSDPATRLAAAQSLLRDRQGLKRLQETLSGEDHEAQKIIFQALAQSLSLLQTDNQAMNFPPELIDPLIKAAQANHPQQSYWIDRILNHSPQQPLTSLLAKMAKNKKRSTPDRLTAIAALQLRPGKKTVTTLVALLDDPDKLISQRAFQSLCKTLATDPSLTTDQFQKQIWTKLKKLSETAFLQQQWAINTEKLWEAEQLNSELANQLEQLKERYLTSQTNWLNQITDPDLKLAKLKGYLQDSDDLFWRIWVLEQINEWCSSSTVSSTKEAQELVELLSKFISDSNSHVRQLTANALEKLVENAQTAAPALAEQLKREDDPRALIAQLEALSILAYLPATPQAIELLNCDLPDVAAQAARMLGNIAAVDSELNTKEQMDQISQALIQRYYQANESAIVRREIINAIWKIASLQSYQPHARTLFPEIHKKALTNADGNCRSFAVRALTELFKQEVFAFILSGSVYLLNDEDPSVRFRVIEAFEKYGHAGQLIALREQLEKEDIADLIKSLRATFIAILQNQSTEKVCQWAKQLQETQDSQNPKELQLLADQVIELLWQKIGEDKTQNLPVPVEMEWLALTQLAHKTEQSSQPEQALSWYQKIIKLQVSEEIKSPYRQKIQEILPPKPPETIPVKTPTPDNAPSENKVDVGVKVEEKN
jgi:HEAT repeat protein